MNKFTALHDQIASIHSPHLIPRKASLVIFLQSHLQYFLMSSLFACITISLKNGVFLNFFFTNLSDLWLLYWSSEGLFPQYFLCLETKHSYMLTLYVFLHFLRVILFLKIRDKDLDKKGKGPKFPPSSYYCLLNTATLSIAYLPGVTWKADTVQYLIPCFYLRCQILQPRRLTWAHLGLWGCNFQCTHFKPFQGVTEPDFWQCLYYHYTFGLVSQGLFCWSLFISCTLRVLSGAFSRLLFIQLESFFPWAAKKF